MHLRVLLSNASQYVPLSTNSDLLPPFGGFIGIFGEARFFIWPHPQP